MRIPFRILLLAAAFLVVPTLWALVPLPPQLSTPPFSISISLAQDVVNADSEVRLDIVLTNTTNENIVIDQCGKPNYQMEVYDSQGKRLPRLDECVQKEVPEHPGWTTVCEITAARPVTVCVPQNQVLKLLKPQESLKEEMVVNELYDLSRPGKYTIQVQRVNDPRTVITVPGHFGYSRDLELHDKMNDVSRDTAKSNTVTVTVEATLPSAP
jgi:hypothetical protein